MADKLPERRFKFKSEILADDLAADLQKETDSINKERAIKGKKPAGIAISRHSEYR
jgi:hypothetical protein